MHRRAFILSLPALGAGLLAAPTVANEYNWTEVGASFTVPATPHWSGWYEMIGHGKLRSVWSRWEGSRWYFVPLTCPLDATETEKRQLQENGRRSLLDFIEHPENHDYAENITNA